MTSKKNLDALGSVLSIQNANYCQLFEANIKIMLCMAII